MLFSAVRPFEQAVARCMDVCRLVAILSFLSPSPQFHCTSLRQQHTAVACIGISYPYRSVPPSAPISSTPLWRSTRFHLRQPFRDLCIPGDSHLLQPPFRIHSFLATPTASLTSSPIRLCIGDVLQHWHSLSFARGASGDDSACGLLVRRD